jgi:hypothetical protein
MLFLNLQICTFAHLQNEKRIFTTIKLKKCYTA